MSHRLRVNPITCEAHGMCAELLPERIALDDWGYPILDERPLDPGARGATPSAPRRRAPRSRCWSSASPRAVVGRFSAVLRSARPRAGALAFVRTPR